MIYGWGTDHRSKQLDPSTVAVCRFRYVSIAFIFSIVWQRRWFIQGRDRAMDREVTPDEIEAAYGPGSVPSPGIWKRFGLVLVPGIVLAGTLAFAMLGAMLNLLGVLPDDETIAADSAVAETQSAADEPVAEYAGDDESTAPLITSDADASSEAAAPEPAAPDADNNDATSGSIDPTDTGSAPIREVAAAVNVVSETNIMSTNRDKLADAFYFAKLNIDDVHTTTIHETGDGETVQATAGSKLAVVDFHMLNISEIPIFNHSDMIFVDDTDGHVFRPLLRGDRIAPSGARNGELLFEIPENLSTFVIRGGADDDDRDGYQSRWEVELAPATASDQVGDPNTDKTIVQGLALWARTSDSDLTDVATAPHITFNNRFDVIDAQITDRVGPVSADPGFKWLVVEFRVDAVETTFSFNPQQVTRLTVDGEVYGTPTDSYDMRIGDLIDASAWYQIPVDATEATLEIGFLPELTESPPVLFELTLPS